MNKHTSENDTLVPEKIAAEILGLSKYTLQQWRFRGRGPAYLKLGGKAIRYDRQVLDAFKCSCVVRPDER